MGARLADEIAAGAPPSWDSTMRLVAILIARAASDGDRRTHGYRIDGYWPANGQDYQPGLCEQSGLQATGVTAALARLAKAGYQMRAAIGTDRRGHPVYAAKGHSTDYIVPSLPARPVPPRPGSETKGRLQPALCDPADGSKGRLQPAHTEPKGRPEPALTEPKGRLQPAPYQSSDVSDFSSKVDHSDARAPRESPAAVHVADEITALFAATGEDITREQADRVVTELIRRTGGQFSDLAAVARADMQKHPGSLLAFARAEVDDAGRLVATGTGGYRPYKNPDNLDGYGLEF